jgi:outer membrane protein, adhesin transport system
LRDSEKLKLQEKVEEIAHKTSQTYLKIMEQRALLGLIDETVAAHEQLARIVQAHNKEGHGTIADVQRVNSRLVDVRAIRADVSLQLMSAEDQLGRLTRKPPGKLADVPDYAKAIPGSADAAITRVLAKNPRLGALQASRQSTQKELEFQTASAYPKINLEVESETKNYRNDKTGRTQPESRAMLAMRYRLMDGGLSSATKDQLHARLEGADFSYLNEREQLEADIRQAYRAIDSAGRKLRLVSQGVESSRKVKELYLEQFKGGKRTIFELLDGQMSFYTIRRSQIEGQFEGKRAMFDILRATGDLTVTLSRRS